MWAVVNALERVCRDVGAAVTGVVRSAGPVQAAVRGYDGNQGGGVLVGGLFIKVGEKAGASPDVAGRGDAAGALHTQ